MKITKFFIIFSSIYILNASLSTKFPLESQINHQNVVKSICKITNEVTKSTTDTQDVLIVESRAINESTTVNEILMCIDNAVVVTEMRKKILVKNLRKAAVIIIDFDRIDGVRLFF